MNIKKVILMLCAIVAFPVAAQIFNFSLRTNNQQLIDMALNGAFVKINQSYELCDTVSDEHFGRDGKDYFNIIPFVGVQTEQGLIFPTATLSPWTYDKDFGKYKERYKPLATKSSISRLNAEASDFNYKTDSPLKGNEISRHICELSDTAYHAQGLKIDSIPGKKNGWLIWISSNKDLTHTDSIKFTSINKEIQVAADGESMHIEDPEIAETVYGGIYVTPTQSSIGELNFSVTGVLAPSDEGWILDFPFIKNTSNNKPLTPIKGIADGSKLNSPKKKKKK